MTATVHSLEAARRPKLTKRGALACENAYRLLCWAWERISITNEDRAAILAGDYDPNSAA